MGTGVFVKRRNWHQYYHPKCANDQHDDDRLRTWGFADRVADWYERTGELVLYGGQYDAVFRSLMLEDLEANFGPLQPTTKPDSFAGFDTDDGEVRAFVCTQCCSSDRWMQFVSEGGWSCESCGKIVLCVQGCLGCARVYCNKCFEGLPNGATLRAIGAATGGLSAERVRNILLEALQKVREGLRILEADCSTCAVRGRSRPARQISWDSHGNHWFECESHMPRDNALKAKRVRSMKLLDWLIARNQPPSKARDDLVFDESRDHDIAPMRTFQNWNPVCSSPTHAAKDRPPAKYWVQFTHGKGKGRSCSRQRCEACAREFAKRWGVSLPPDPPPKPLPQSPSRYELWLRSEPRWVSGLCPFCERQVFLDKSNPSQTFHPLPACGDWTLYCGAKGVTVQHFAGEHPKGFEESNAAASN